MSFLKERAQREGEIAVRSDALGQELSQIHATAPGGFALPGLALARLPPDPRLHRDPGRDAPARRGARGAGLPGARRAAARARHHASRTSPRRAGRTGSARCCARAERLAAETAAPSRSSACRSARSSALHLAATHPTPSRALVLCGTPHRAARDSALRLLPARSPACRGVADALGDDPEARRRARHRRSRGARREPELPRDAARGHPRAARAPARRARGARPRRAAGAAAARPPRPQRARSPTSCASASGSARAHVEAHVLERSWHVVTLDYDRDEVARLAGGLPRSRRARRVSERRPPAERR